MTRKEYIISYFWVSTYPTSLNGFMCEYKHSWVYDTYITDRGGITVRVQNIKIKHTIFFTDISQRVLNYGLCVAMMLLGYQILDIRYTGDFDFQKGFEFNGFTVYFYFWRDSNCPPISSLKTIPSGAFKPLQSLEMLVLDNNLLSTLTLTALDGLSNLQVAYFPGIHKNRKKKKKNQRLSFIFFKHIVYGS